MRDIQKFETNFTDRILYLLPYDLDDKGGMTEITKMFYQVGLFDNKNINHFNTFYKWGDLNLIKMLEAFIHQLNFIKILILFRPKIIFVMTSAYIGFFDKCLYCFFARIFGVKSMLNQVGDFSNFYEDSIIKAYFIRLFLKIPNVILVGSTYWNNYFKKEFQSRNIISIVNPVVSELYYKSTNFKSDKIRIITISSLITAKGIVELVAVIKRVCSISDKFVFVIMGRGEKLEWVRNELQLEIDNGYVEVKGQVSDEEKIHEFSIADLFILLSHNEVIPISMLEAMSASLPIIGTKVGGIPDIVVEGENGYLFDRMTIEPIVRRILKIGNEFSKEDLKLMGINSNSIVKSKYDIIKVLEKHLDLAKNMF